MSLSTVGDLQTELLVRNNRTTTDSFITDAMLDDWFRQAHIWAAGYKKWPMTEGRVSTTYVSAQEEWNYPEGWKPDSIRLLKLGDKRYQRLAHEDYQIFREEQSDSDKRVWADFGSLYLVTPNAPDSGTLYVWGQYTPYVDTSDKTATTVFSNRMEEGNEAILLKMTQYLKERENDRTAADKVETKAKVLLEEGYKRYKDEQFTAHSTDRGMFKRIDVLHGSFEGEINREDRWY